MRVFDRFRGKKGGEVPEDDFEFGEEDFSEPSMDGIDEPDLIDLEEEKEEISEELDFRTPSSEEEEFGEGIGVSELESVAAPRRRLPELPAIPVTKILTVALIVVVPLVVGYFARPLVEPVVNRAYLAVVSLVKGEKIVPATVVLKNLEAERKELQSATAKYKAVGRTDEITLIQTELEGRLELYSSALAVMDKIKNWDQRQGQYDALAAKHADLSERLYQRQVTLSNVDKGMRQNEDRLNFLRSEKKLLLTERDHLLSRSDLIKKELGQSEAERVVEQAHAAKRLTDLLSQVGVEALENSSHEASLPEATGGTF